MRQTKGMWSWLTQGEGNTTMAGTGKEYHFPCLRAIDLYSYTWTEVYWDQFMILNHARVSWF